MTEKLQPDEEIRIRAVDPGYLPHAAPVLAESFREEAFNRTLMDLSTLERQQQHARLTQLLLLIRHYRGAQFYAATQGGKVAGVAIVKPAGARMTVPWYRLLTVIARLVPRILLMLGAVRWRRVLRVGPAIKAPRTLVEPYCTLEILGVAPSFQGRGIGRKLVEHVHAQCDRSTGSTGVYLYTGDEVNTQIYARLGYEVIEVKQGGPLTVWHMFRARGTSS